MKEIKYFGEKVFVEQREMASQAKTWTIYKITNKENGKIYIGQTNQEPNTRMSKHFCDAKSGRKNVAISSALNKYGKNGFIYEILQYANSSEEADNLEKEYIKHFRSNEKDFGYNLTEGGKALSESFVEKGRVCVHPPMTLEHKNILINVNRNRVYPPMSEEMKLHMSKIMKEKHQKGLIKTNLPLKNQKGELHPMFGKTHSEEAKRKIVIHAETEREVYAERVIELYSNGKTIQEISLILGIGRNMISKILHKHAVKLRVKGDYEKRKIYRYSKEGDFIDEWESEPAFYRATGIHARKVLDGISIFSGGFFFNYEKVLKEEVSAAISARLERKRKKREFCHRPKMTEERKKIMSEINKGNNYRGRIENIKQLDKDNNLIKIWKDSKEIVIFYGLKNATPVLRVIKGERKFFKKFKWSL